VQAAHRCRKAAVGRQRVIHARRRENREVEEAERRDRDRGSHKRSTGRTEPQLRGIGRRRRRLRQTTDAERPQVGHIREDVHHDDDRRASKKRPRQRPLRPVHFFRDVVRVLPAAVCEEDGDERRAQRKRRSCRGRGTGGPVVTRRQHQAGNDQNRKRSDFENDEHVQDAAAWLNASDVDRREEDDSRDRHRARRGRRSTGESEGILGKRQRDGCDRARLDADEECPAIEKAGEGMQTITKVDVLAAGTWKAGAELGPDERADERDRAAECPDEQD
jgi:hypothetical protein